MQHQQVIDHVVSWIRQYHDKAGTTGFVVGVSGGIDSALTSTLGAMSGAELTCVDLPIHQHPSQVNRAAEHIHWLQSKFDTVRSQQIDLTSVFDNFKSQMPQHDQASAQMALVNSRARLRMTTLYYIAGLENKLVLGTGNKVEDFGVGFYTKYGDGGVDLSPIADLSKTEVFALAKHLGIVDSIQCAAPTDGLWGDDRTDEDQIGATYPELEWAMTFDGSKEQLSERQLEVLTIYERLHTANQHKMQPIPVCEIPADLKS